MTDTITSIQTYLVPGDDDPARWCPRKAYVFMRVETSSGAVGWGEGYTLNLREKSLVALIHALGETLIGTNATAIRAVIHKAFNAFGEHRAGIDVFAAAAGIEIALWDALGKSLGAPVYTLLGGACHERLEIYANIWTRRPVTPDQLAAKAAAQVADGFRALKAYPFIAGGTDEEGVAKLAAIREAVGPDVKIAVDLWRHSTPDRARDLCAMMESFNLDWVEDPFAPSNALALRTLREQVRQPILVGETLASRRDFREIFEKQAVSKINPDICAAGIVEMREIAAMAEPYFITVSPHNYNSMALGGSIMAHVAAGIPNLGLCEYFPEVADDLDHLCEGRLIPEQGTLSLPTAPGLGVTFDEAQMEQFRVEP